MNADEKNALRNEATASVASMGPNAKAMLLSSDILRYLDEIDRLEARIAKLIETGDDMRQEWCGHNHGMMGTKAPRSCGRCVVEEAWDTLKGGAK